VTKIIKTERVITSRKKSITIQSDNIEFFDENLDSKMLAHLRCHYQDQRVVIIANFSNQYLAGYRVLNFPTSGTWRELMGSEVLADDSLTINLPEYEAKVFVYQ
jgi:1,4-alpha-glucan branching enzyme